MQTDFQKESFWQRVGLKKINNEMPLFNLGIDKLKHTRMTLQEVFDQAFHEQKELLLRKLSIIKRH